MAKQTKKNNIGTPMDRVDGRLKVTGAAKYFADYNLPGLTYASLVCSTVAKGRITKINTAKASLAPGVITIISHVNSPVVEGYRKKSASAGNGGNHELQIFQSDRIYSNGQPIAIVVADTLERAVYGASLVSVEYSKEISQTDLSANLDKSITPKDNEDYLRGTANAYKTAPVQIEENYSMPSEVHNPMELAGMIAHWEASDKLTVYVKTQIVKEFQNALHETFNIPLQNVNVHSEFVGGAFGMALRVWPHEIATILAARKTGKPVKLVIGRDQMFTMVGYRPNALQKIGIGATADGKLVGISHEATAITSSYEEFTESIVNVSRYLYACPNVDTKYRIVPLNLSTPIWMRGPGEATGAFALESAIDELSYALKMDPIELRLVNYSETDPERNIPFSSKFLKEAYQMGAEKIGWNERNPKPRSMREGEMLLGYGMSSGTFGAYREKATAAARLLQDGSLEIRSASSDIGPGTTTAMVQIASDSFGLPVENIKFFLGESAYPNAPGQGGSATVASVGSAVYDSCIALQKKLLALAASKEKDFSNSSFEEVSFENGFLSDKANPSIKIAYTDILEHAGKPYLEVITESVPSKENDKYSMGSFSVHFTKVHVHPLTGVVKVIRIVSVADSGTIINSKTARSQMIGGSTGGIGMALTEEAVIDHRYGRYVNNNLADYHLPVHADVPAIDSLFVNKKDPYINPMGAKGMGEIALIGFAAAVANAVFHATGKRIRELPITPDKLI